MPGTEPLTLSTIPVMPLPGWKVTSAEVSIAVGGVPSLASAFDRAIEKQVAWAAPSSSSGLVLPFAASAREGQLTSNFPTPDDSRVTCPAPSIKEPSQWARAVRVVAMVVLLGSGKGLYAGRPLR